MDALVVSAITPVWMARPCLQIFWDEFRPILDRTWSGLLGRSFTRLFRVCLHVLAQLFICSWLVHLSIHTPVRSLARSRLVPFLIWSCPAQVSCTLNKRGYRYMYERAYGETGRSWQLRRNEAAWK